MTALIANQRPLFDLPEGVVYLNTAYMSPSLHAVTQAGIAGVRLKAHPWQVEPAHFFTGAEQARALFAQLIGAQADDIAIIPAASYGLAIAARNLPLTAGQDIVLLDNQFPANVHPWVRRARESGARLVTVPQPGPDDADPTWTPRILDAITARTAIVALPHCHWTDGSLIDLHAVSAGARAVGAALVLDLAQSAGALPFDVARVRPDYAVAPTYKWLLGPYSFGFAYIAPHRQDGVPLEETWIGREGSEDFAGLVDYREAYAPGARRFDMGQRAQFHLLPMAVAALERLLAWRVEAIAATLCIKTDSIAARARALGLDPGAPGTRAPHFAGIRFPNGLPEGLLDALRARHIYLSIRGTSLRVTPHLYTTDEDIDILFRTLSELLP